MTAPPEQPDVATDLRAPDRIGRPQKAPRDDENRRHFGMQMPAHLRSQLQAAAELSQRSLSAEALARLEQSFDRQGLLGQVLDLSYRNPQLVGVLLVMAEAMRDTLATVADGPDWIDDPGTFDQVARAVCTVVEAFRPEADPPAPERLLSQIASHGVIRSGGDSSDGGIIPGEGVARFVMFRLAGNWSQPLPWMTEARLRIGATLDRLRERATRGYRIARFGSDVDVNNFIVGMGMPVADKTKGKTP